MQTGSENATLPGITDTCDFNTFPVPSSALVMAKTHRGSHVRSVLMRYRGILEGTYYPAVSIYTLPNQDEGASVSANFGE